MNVLVENIKLYKDKLIGDCVTKSRDYERELADIIRGVSTSGEPNWDIEKFIGDELFLIEVKKQKMGQWIDICKLAEIELEDNKSKYDNIVFWYIFYEEKKVTESYFVSLEKMLLFYKIDRERAKRLVEIKSFYNNFQTKVKIKKREVVEIADYVI